MNTMEVPTIRFYGEFGWPEKLDKCAAGVYMGFSMFQCSRKRVTGILCKQHDQMKKAHRYICLPAPHYNGDNCALRQWELENSSDHAG